MTKIRPAGWLLLVPVLLAPPLLRAATSIFNPVEMASRTLANGVRVVARETPGSGLVAIQLWIRAGSRFETPENNGAAHLIEHLVFQNDRPDSAAQVIEDAGGTVNGETEKDSTRYAAIVPSESFPAVLKAMARAARESDWSQRDLLFARDSVTQELMGRMLNPVRHANDLAYRAAFRTHPYRLIAGGAPDSLPSITLAALRQFHTRFYVGANMSLVVVGDVPAARVFTEAAAALGAIKVGESSRALTFPPETWTSPRDLTVNLPFRLATLSFAFRAPGMATPQDVWAMDVLVTLLGDSRHARLHRQLVEELKVAVAVDAQFLTHKDPGLLTLTLLATPANLTRAQQALMDEVRALRDGKIADDEIAHAKATLAGTYALQNETAEGQASSLGFYEAIATHEIAVRYDSLVRAVTPAQVRAAAHKYLDPEAYVRVLIRAPRGGLGARR